MNLDGWRSQAPVETPPAYLVRLPEKHGYYGGYSTIYDRAKAYETASMLTACASCGTWLEERVTFEYRSSQAGENGWDTYLAVTCLTCAPLIWARIAVEAEDRKARESADG